uniref:Uncharacterized protein n=1 Tax=Kalanchoe fedtschenkoi TaxID=63787 RepID=A0A7N0TXT5_KALFE
MASQSWKHSLCAQRLPGSRPSLTQLREPHTQLRRSCNGSKFHSCVFHPSYASLRVVGCYQSLELWNMTENKAMTLSAHGGLIASLAMSTATGHVRL